MMSKKKSFGKFLALAAVVGTAAAAVSYFLRYRSFSRELDKDFHDFEGEDDLFEEEPAPHRNYVTLPKVEEALKEATGQAVEKAKSAANIVRETVKIAAEKTRGAGREAVEAAQTAETTEDMKAAEAADAAKAVQAAEVAEDMKAAESAQTAETTEDMKAAEAADAAEAEQAADAAKEVPGTAAEEPVSDSAEEFDLFAGQSDKPKNATSQTDAAPQITEEADSLADDAPQETDKAKIDSASGATIVDDEQ